MKSARVKSSNFIKFFFQDVISHRTKLNKKKGGEIQILNNTDNQGIKSLSKERRKTLETYQQLFYLLQVRTVSFPLSFGSILWSVLVVYVGLLPGYRTGGSHVLSTCQVPGAILDALYA